MDPETSNPMRSLSYYYMDLIVFQVENTLFKVPRQYFLEKSSIFRDMFSVPQSQIEGSSPEGSSDENPLRLDGISKVDFERLLKVIYPSQIPPTYQLMQRDEWFSVLKLAKMWYLTDVHALALRTMASHGPLSHPMDPVDMIVIAKEHYVPGWLQAGYIQLVRRKSALSIEEARRIGFPSSILVFHVREKRTAGLSGTIESWVQTTFAEELKDLVEQRKNYILGGLGRYRRSL